MAAKTTAKPKVKNGIDKKEISMTYIDDILLRIDKAEGDIDGVLQTIDGLDLRVGKVEARLGIG
jgi:hypothetical protein|tara:strand:- start:938 stop:1129 length:192 start_codon:yes stop_codon:yes gene_type:complete